MIYVSSSCVRHKKIAESVTELASNGFRNIELSGGTEHYDGFESDLLELKAKFNLNYLCHNYFPPPKEHFVLNLASFDDGIYKKTIEHLKCALKLSKELGVPKFGFHAGFFVDIRTDEIGKKINKKTVNDYEKATERFINGYREVAAYADGLEIYLENNVFSRTNYETYGGENIFMLCTSASYYELAEQINFKLLLDAAHLKVSCNTLGLDFGAELKTMLELSDYIHLSSNDGLHDQNHPLAEDKELISMLKQHNLEGKDFTLEIYGGLDVVHDSLVILQELGL